MIHCVRLSLQCHRDETGSVIRLDDVDVRRNNGTTLEDRHYDVWHDWTNCISGKANWCRVAFCPLPPVLRANLHGHEPFSYMWISLIVGSWNEWRLCYILSRAIVSHWNVDVGSLCLRRDERNLIHQRYARTVARNICTFSRQKEIIPPRLIPIWAQLFTIILNWQFHWYGH